MSNNNKFGSVGRLEDGARFVRFERRLLHSVEKVWSAITDPNELANWFPGFKAELREGGHFQIWFGEGCEGPAHVSGTVTCYEPPCVFQCGSMRYELERDGDGCLLTFTDVVQFPGSRTEDETTNSVLSGWHWFLDALEDALAGRAVDPHKPEPDYSKIDVPGREL